MGNILVCETCSDEQNQLNNYEFQEDQSFVLDEKPIKIHIEKRQVKLGEE